MEDLYAEHDYNTLSGLILEILERVPKTGEKLSWLNFEFEIVDMDGARIDKVLVSRYLRKNKPASDICQPVQHFHLAEKDEQITFFDSQVSGDFVDDGVLGLF